MIALRILLVHTNKRGYDSLASKTCTSTQDKFSDWTVTFIADSLGITFNVRSAHNSYRMSTQEFIKLISYMQDYLDNHLPAIDRGNELEIVM